MERIHLHTATVGCASGVHRITVMPSSQNSGMAPGPLRSSPVRLALKTTRKPTRGADATAFAKQPQVLYILTRMMALAGGRTGRSPEPSALRYTPDHCAVWSGRGHELIRAFSIGSTPAKACGIPGPSSAGTRMGSGFRRLGCQLYQGSFAWFARLVRLDGAWSNPHWTKVASQPGDPPAHATGFLTPGSDQ